MNFKDIPIQRKLMGVILFTCSAALVLMCGAYMVFEFFSYRETVKRNTSTLAIIVASNSSAALAFDSREDAVEILSAFQADKGIVAACVYDSNGRLFAKYPSDYSSDLLPSGPGRKGSRFNGKYLESFQPVVQSGERLGTLYIKSDLTAMYAQLQRYALIAVFLMAVSLLLAYFLSRLLQKTISRPILALEETAKIISQKHDYSVRAEKMGNDELGSLTDAFNQMLAQIETQNLEIVKAGEESSTLAAIVESSSDAIIGLSLDLTIASWNNSAERMLGYTAAEIAGRPILQIVSSERQDQEQHALEQLKKKGQAAPFETQFITKDKKLLDVSVTISPVRNAAGEIIGISQIARDISKQKQSERRIIENEEHLRLATQAAELGTFDWNMLNGTIEWDTRCRELAGVQNDVSISYDTLLNRLHKDDRKRVNRIIETAFNKSLSNGYYEAEYRVMHTENKFRWLRAKGKVFFDEEDKPLRFIGTVLDITSKKQEEIRKNDFIAIISHELKTPLTTIKAYVQLLLEKADKKEDNFSVNALKRAEVQANKMASMIKDFLSLAKIEEGKIRLAKEIFELRPMLEDTASAAHLLTASHNIQLEDCMDIKIKADKDKIGQVMINLLSNAAKYSPSKSTITIGCVKDNGKVRVYVRDEGIGISLNDQRKLFTRFYRVENEKMKTVSGFGIGLYIVSEILRYHGSAIEVESEEGRGSTFYFSLDIVSDI